MASQRRVSATIILIIHTCNQIYFTLSWDNTMYNADTIRSYAELTDDPAMLFRSIVMSKAFVSDKIKIGAIY